MNATNGLVEGARVVLTFRSKDGERIVPATLGQVGPVEADGIRFTYRPDDNKHGLWGVSTFRSTPRPFGLQKVEVLS